MGNVPFFTTKSLPLFKSTNYKRICSVNIPATILHRSREVLIIKPYNRFNELNNHLKKHGLHNEHNFELKLMASHVFCWIKVSLFIINVRKELLLLLNSNILSTLCWSFPETIAYSLQILAGIPQHQAFQKKGVLALSVSILFCY